jgi:hypothetical protein
MKLAPPFVFVMPTAGSPYTCNSLLSTGSASNRLPPSMHLHKKGFSRARLMEPHMGADRGDTMENARLTLKIWERKFG